MAMVFCRGCAKEIHETAQVCPHCGAPQGLSTNSNTSRNTVVLIVMAFGWTLIMWFLFLLLGGFIIGAMNPDNAGVAGQQFGRAASVPSLLLLGCVSAILTKLGKLPGTKKN